MKKNPILLAMLVVLLALSVALVIGCKNDDDDSSSGGGGGKLPAGLEGKWGTGGQKVLEFLPSGNFDIAGGATYETSISGSTVTCSTFGIKAGTFDYALNGTQLTISNITGGGLHNSIAGTWEKIE